MFETNDHHGVSLQKYEIEIIARDGNDISDVYSDEEKKDMVKQSRLSDTVTNNYLYDDDLEGDSFNIGDVKVIVSKKGDTND